MTVSGTHHAASRLIQATDESVERLKFAAHKLCNEDNDMKNDIIPHRARCFSRRFLSSIKPLLEAHETNEPGVSQDSVSWATETQNLTDIFTAALRIKARLLLTTDLYQCFWPAPGTIFDGHSMASWDADHSIARWDDEHSPQQRGESDRKVALTVFPGLFRYDVNHRVFSYNRFVSRETEPEAGRRLLLSQAIVVTG